jgi:hypothetical protein
MSSAEIVHVCQPQKSGIGRVSFFGAEIGDVCREATWPLPLHCSCCRLASHAWWKTSRRQGNSITWMLSWRRAYQIAFKRDTRRDQRVSVCRHSIVRHFMMLQLLLVLWADIFRRHCISKLEQKLGRCVNIQGLRAHLGNDICMQLSYRSACTDGIW